MCNKFDVIKDVIAKKTDANEMFTAYDVTSAARKQEGEFIDKHNKIKRDVHAAFSNGDMPTLYVRTLVGLEDKVGKFTEVFMYHDISSNPTDYQPEDKDIKVVSLDGDTVDTDEDETEDDDESYTKDKDGRLNIPQKFLREARIEVGALVSATFHNDEIRVSFDNTFNPNPLQCNADGRIRLNKIILDNITEPYQISVKNDTIVISSK